MVYRLATGVRGSLSHWPGRPDPPGLLTPSLISAVMSLWPLPENDLSRTDRPVGSWPGPSYLPATIR